MKRSALHRAYLLLSADVPEVVLVDEGLFGKIQGVDDRLATGRFGAANLETDHLANLQVLLFAFGFVGLQPVHVDISVAVEVADGGGAALHGDRHKHPVLPRLHADGRFAIALKGGNPILSEQLRDIHERRLVGH